MSKSVTCLIFGIDPSHILAASEDIRIIGIKSGKILREFKGHLNYVNDLLISDDGTKLVSGASDGSIKFWNYSTSECILNFQLN